MKLFENLFFEKSVKRRSEVPAELDFLSRDDADDIETVPALRAKTQNLQIKILEQVRELERSERMLQAQNKLLTPFFCLHLLS